MAQQIFIGHTYKSVSITNIAPVIANVNWSPGLSAWSSYVSKSSSIKKYGTQSLCLTATASLSEIYVTTTTSYALDKTHKYYISYWVYTPTTNSAFSTNVYWPGAVGGETAAVVPSASATWLQCSHVKDYSSTSISSGNHGIRLDFNNNEIAGSVYFDGLVIVDLTACFGSGNEPTVDWCKSNISYFTGTTQVEFPVSSSVARKVKNIYIGDANGKAQKVKYGYIGDANGKAQRFYSACSDCTGECVGCTGCTGGCTSCSGCTGTCQGCTGCTNSCTNACTGCTSCSGCTGCTNKCTNACTSCTGCTGGCTSCSGCTDSCSGCGDSCSYGCTGCTGCGDACGGGCTGCSGCGYGCADSCYSGCTDSCEGCGSSCSSGCGGSCDSSCSSGCGGGCYGGCSGSCSGQCQASCTAACEAYCDGGCATYCSGCGNTCTGCSGDCSDTCASGCQGSCESSADGS